MGNAVLLMEEATPACVLDGDKYVEIVNWRIADRYDIGGARPAHRERRGGAET
jgi:hypothetical protein